MTKTQLTLWAKLIKIGLRFLKLFKIKLVAFLRHAVVTLRLLDVDSHASQSYNRQRFRVAFDDRYGM